VGRRQALIIAALLVSVPAGAEDLIVSVPDEVTGDGRTAVPVNVTGTLAGETKPLPVTEVAVVSCTDAADFAAIGNQALPSVLAPATTVKRILSCSTRLRDKTRNFEVRLRPPGPGLYAPVHRVARTSESEAVLQAFAFDGTTSSPPSWLRAATSDGTATVRHDGLMTLGLSGKAPRTIAVAMVDGTRVGAAFVPVTGSTVLPVESEAGSSMQVWVAGTWFGPVPTKGRMAEVPIDVPAGVTHGVARSTDKKGYASDVVVDLKIPGRPRIAVATATRSIGASQSMTLAAAIVGANGRPLPPTAKVVASAERGKVGAAEAVGAGLWKLEYTAPDALGPDRILVTLDGDPSAGTGEAAVDVRTPAAKIELTMAPAFDPGSELTGTIRVLDAGGIVLREPDITATLDGQPLQVRPGDTLTLVGKAPQKTPPQGLLPLVIRSGSVKVETNVFVGGWPSSASLDVSARDRDVRAEVRIVDRVGNLVPEATFEIVATGAKLSGIKREGDIYVASLNAVDGIGHATGEVRSKGKRLADRSVMIDAPGMASIGAYAAGGWLDNLGAFTSTRAALGGGVKYRFASFEAAGFVGLEALLASDSVMVDVGGGGMQNATRSLSGIALPLTVRARKRLGNRFGIAAGVAVLPWRMRVQFGPDGQSEPYGETVFGVRVQAAGDMELGPGRAVVGMSFGRASLSNGPVTGQIDGFGFTFGYEWWFRAFVP